MAGTGRGWMAAAISAGLLSAPCGAAAAEALHSPTIGVLLMDDAGVAPEVLAHAKIHVTRIYREIGITVAWMSADDIDVDRRLTVKIVTKAFASKGIDGRTMGIAAGTPEKRGTLAYAFYSRIEGVTRTTGADTGLILGHVIAHEIGHLLLPYGAHAERGLMRGAWDQEQAYKAAVGRLRFTLDEGALIRARMQTLPERTTSASPLPVLDDQLGVTSVP